MQRRQPGRASCRERRCPGPHLGRSRPRTHERARRSRLTQVCTATPSEESADPSASRASRCSAGSFNPRATDVMTPTVPGPQRGRRRSPLARLGRLEDAPRPQCHSAGPDALQAREREVRHGYEGWHVVARRHGDDHVDGRRCRRVVRARDASTQCGGSGDRRRDSAIAPVATAVDPDGSTSSSALVHSSSVNAGPTTIRAPFARRMTSASAPTDGTRGVESRTTLSDFWRLRSPLVAALAAGAASGASGETTTAPRRRVAADARDQALGLLLATATASASTVTVPAPREAPPTPTTSTRLRPPGGCTRAPVSGSQAMMAVAFEAVSWSMQPDAEARVADFAEQGDGADLADASLQKGTEVGPQPGWMHRVAGRNDADRVPAQDPRGSAHVEERRLDVRPLPALSGKDLAPNRGRRQARGSDRRTR